MFRTYYDSNEIQSYNALVNLSLSDRSDGKTLDIKAKAFFRYVKYNAQTVFLRRWDKTEITKELYETFFNRLIERVESKAYTCFNEEEKAIIYSITEYEFLGTKSAIYIRKKGCDKWDIICYILALSISGKKKSHFDETRITHIEYDEFVPLDGRYMPNEMSILMEFYKTIDRDRDTTILSLYGNRIDAFNPFFDFFDVHIGIQKERIKTYKNGTVAVQIYINPEHREERKKSRFNEMVKDTDYEDYNNGGTLINRVIKISNTNGCEYFLSFKTFLGEGSIYGNENKVVITSNKRKDGEIICDKIYNTGRKEYMCTFGGIPQFIKRNARTGRLFYDSEKTYHIFEPILNKIGGLK